MYAYCNNNPVMFVDCTGESPFGVMCIVVIATFLLTGLTSSEKQEPTQNQVQQAVEAANRAKIKVVEDESGSVKRIDIAIDTQDVIDSVDELAYDHYYERLYERTVDKAMEEDFSEDSLMSVEHIRWEFSVHALGHVFGIPSCAQADLDYDETIWTILGRAIKW